MMFNPSKFLVGHFLMPLVALIVIAIVITVADLDRTVADYFYLLQGHSWAWKDTWIAEVLFHRGARALSLILALVLLASAIASYFSRWLGVHKKPLFYLFFATSGSSFLINFFKSSLAVSCPWEFERYGGNLIYSNVVEQLFLRNGSECFPAGHASAGYAWISCYFFGLYYQSKWRKAGLIAPLLAGLVLGFVQQIRGAHFISHDVFTLALCWFFSLGLFCVLLKFTSEKLAAPELICQ